MRDIIPYGDRALRFALPSDIDRRQLLASLGAAREFMDVVLAEELGAVIFDERTLLRDAASALERILTAPPAATTTADERSGASPAGEPARHTIHVVYDGDDLSSLAAETELTIDEVIALHSGRDYEVAMLGFLPGFAYLRGVDPRLAVARRASPRARVRPGSVAIAAGYTGIYPFASPGGWHLLGEAIDFRPFDEERATFAIGDRVRFERAAARRAERPVTIDAPPVGHGARGLPEGPYLEVQRVQGPALVVDRGRPGRMHEGVPHGGPLVPQALARANRAVGNDPGDAAIEVYGLIELVARGGGIGLADDVRGAITLEDGEVFAVATDGSSRVRYLAVEAAIDVPIVLGGRGTLLVAGMGGLDGRMLRRGDRIESPSGATRSPSSARNPMRTRSTTTTTTTTTTTVPIVVGPDATEDWIAAFIGATFTVSPMSDRTGTRLEGPSMPSMQTARDRKSTPMVLGAIEITPAGPVVLGPDHPTTGGYPVAGIVRSHAIGALFALPIGARIRFEKTVLQLT